MGWEEARKSRESVTSVRLVECSRPEGGCEQAEPRRRGNCAAEESFCNSRLGLKGKRCPNCNKLYREALRPCSADFSRDSTAPTCSSFGSCRRRYRSEPSRTDHSNTSSYKTTLNKRKSSASVSFDESSNSCSKGSDKKKPCRWWSLFMPGGGKNSRCIAGRGKWWSIIGGLVVREAPGYVRGCPPPARRCSASTRASTSRSNASAYRNCLQPCASTKKPCRCNYCRKYHRKPKHYKSGHCKRARSGRNSRSKISSCKRSGSRPSSRSSRRTCSRSSRTCSKPSSRPCSRSPSRPCSRSHSRPCSRTPSRPCSRPASRPCSRPSSRPCSRPPSRPSSRPPSRPCSRSRSRPCSRPPSRPCSRPPSTPCSRPPSVSRSCKDSCKKPVCAQRPRPPPPPPPTKCRGPLSTLWSIRRYIRRKLMYMHPCPPRQRRPVPGGCGRRGPPPPAPLTECPRAPGPPPGEDPPNRSCPNSQTIQDERNDQTELRENNLENM